MNLISIQLSKNLNPIIIKFEMDISYKLGRPKHERIFSLRLGFKTMVIIDSVNLWWF